MSSLNYMELCRLCLVKDRVQIPIFEGEGDIRQIFLKIAACLPVKVKKDDKLPKKICDDCMYKVEMLYQFWNTTANAEKQLLEWLGEAVEEKKTNNDTHVKQESMEQDPGSELAKSLSRVEAVLAEAREAESDNDNFAGSNKAETDSDDEPLSSLEPTTFVNVGLNGSGTNESNTQGEFLAPGAPSTSKTNSTNAQMAASGDNQDSWEASINPCSDVNGTPWIDATNTTELVNQNGEEEIYESIGMKVEHEESNIQELGNNENVDTNQAKTSNQTKKKKNRTGRTIFRPSEYNYPQKCEYCGQVFLEKEMVRHKKVHPESFTLDCIPCGKYFSTKAAYDSHYNVHKIYHCVSCKKDFNARKHYRSHMERIHKSQGERPRIHECDICHKTFKDKFVLNTHKKTHFNIKAHKCPLCEYACNNLTYMRQHVMNHTNQLQFKCHICYRGFMTDADLQKHIDKLHANEPQVYSCDVCGKISTSKGNLRQHQRIHNPEHNQKKDHQCFECGKTFSLKCRLKKHLLSHKGQDKCHCKICGKLLSKDSYKKHLKAHSGEKPYLCDICGESFTTNGCLMAHRRTHTGEKPCKPFTCEQCGKTYVQPSVLASHKRTHTGERPYFCDDCGKTFAQPSLLSTHRKVHTTEHVFTCELCGKAFSQQSLLLSHRNSYHVTERPYMFISFTNQQ